MILIGCGKSKQSKAAPARELYTGSLFRAARDYAEGTGQPWAIVSAKYGLILPSQVIAPYEFRLSQLGPEGRAQWAELVVQQLLEWHSPAKVVLLMGTEYATPLAKELSWRGIKSAQPLVGLGLGKRLQWFKERR